MTVISVRATELLPYSVQERYTKFVLDNKAAILKPLLELFAEGTRLGAFTTTSGGVGFGLGGENYELDYVSFELVGSSRPESGYVNVELLFDERGVDGDVIFTLSTATFYLNPDEVDRSVDSEFVWNYQENTWGEFAPTNENVNLQNLADEWDVTLKA